MKKLITNYSFNAAAKTVTFSDFSTISLPSVLLITNVVSNVIIYNFADPALGGSVATNVLTLDYNTASMNNGDALQVWYDDTSVQPANSALQLDSQAILEALQYLINEIAFLSMVRDPANGSLRVNLSPTATNNISTVATVTALTNLNIIGSSGTNTTFPAGTLVPNVAQQLAIQSNINNVIVTA
jgi:hypothetical protein